jgi:hypothetical protein
MTGSSNHQVQTRPRHCAEHGLVEGTRPVPRLAFPFVITGALRLVALTRPFRCPRCGATTAKA